MDTFRGLPAHPLLVHVPIVLLPLSTVLLLLALWPAARRPALLAAVVLAVVGAVGVVLAVGAGESLEDRVPRTELVHDHAEAGDRAQLPAIVFAVVTTIGVGAIEWRRRATARVDATPEGVGGPRPTPAARWLLPVVLVASLVTGVVSSTLVLDAGHSGSKAVWDGTANQP